MSSLLKPIYEFGPFRLDAARCLLLRGDEQVALSPRVFETLLALVENGGRVVGKDELIRRIWPDTFVEEGNLAQNIFVLRKALGEAPNDHRYIVTVPGRGYRFVADVLERHEFPSALSNHASAESASAAENFKSPPSVAVLPFRTLSDENGDAYLGLGLADALITKLSNVNKLAVASTASVLRYGGLEQNPLAAARQLGADTVLEGYVQRQGERIRVTVQMIRTADGVTLWAGKFDEKFTDVFAVQDSISEQVAEALTLKLTREEQRQLARRYTENAEAFQFYIKGRYFWNKRTIEGLKKAIEYAQQAIAGDPAYALAYVGLADSYNLLAGHGGLPPRETFPKAKAAALRALEIDDTLAEAHASLGFVTYRFDWDWAEAEKRFRHAIALKPNYATAHHWYGESLALSGRFDESLAAFQRAQELDPLSLPINTDLGQTLFFARRYEESEEQLRKTLEMDSSFVRALIILGAVYEQLGDYTRAVATLQRAVEVSGGSDLALSGLAHAHGRAGRRSEARRILDDLKRSSRTRYVSCYNMAVACLGLGEREQALDLLEKSCEARDVWLVWLKINPRFDALRAEPRFAELMRHVRIAP